MTETERIEVHNFYRAARLKSGLKDQLCDWLRDFSTIYCEKLAPQLPFDIEIELRGADTCRPESALTFVQEGSVGYRVIVGDDEAETLVTMPKRLTRALVNGLLGDPTAAADNEGELTRAETSVFKYIIEMLATCSADCRIYGQPVNVKPRRELYNLHRMIVFKPGDNVVRADFEFRGPFGTESWCWLIPYGTLSNLFEPEKQPGEHQDAQQRIDLEQLVQQMHTEFYSRLGKVKLSVTDLESLQEGDLVILDQKIARPLSAFVGGKQAFWAWPGRVGNRQAVLIDSWTKD